MLNGFVILLPVDEFIKAIGNSRIASPVRIGFLVFVMYGHGNGREHNLSKNVALSAIL
jgi:hypothetical protein